MLGIGLPADGHSNVQLQKQSIVKRLEEEIDLDPLYLSSKQLLRDRAGFAFSVSKFNDKLVEIA